MKNNLRTFIFALVALSMLIGCGQEIPPGHLGRVKHYGGFDDTVHAPGRTYVSPRSTLYLLEISDQRNEIRMSILCEDELNFSFTVSLLYSVNQEDEEALSRIFERLTPAGGGRVITAAQLFETYIKQTVDQEARIVVSGYTTREIARSRVQIIEELVAAITESLQGSIVHVQEVTVNNLDFPDIITEAQERRARREIDIETERAEQRIRELQAQNELRLAEIEYQKQLIEAAMIADFNRIIGESITDGFLAWWQLKNFSEAASGPNNFGFIPYTDFVNGSSPIRERTSTEGLIDAELLQRLEEARSAATATPNGSDEEDTTSTGRSLLNVMPSAPSGQ